MPGVTTKIRRRQARAFAYKSDCPQGREFRPATPQDQINLDRRIKQGTCKSPTTKVDFGSRRPQQIHIQVHPCSPVSLQSWACSVFVSVPGVVDTAAEDIHTFHPRLSTRPRDRSLGVHPSVFDSNRINFYELFLKYCWKPNKVFQIRFSAPKVVGAFA